VNIVVTLVENIFVSVTGNVLSVVTAIAFVCSGKTETVINLDTITKYQNVVNYGKKRLSPCSNAEDIVISNFRLHKYICFSTHIKKVQTAGFILFIAGLHNIRPAGRMLSANAFIAVREFFSVVKYVAKARPRISNCRSIVSSIHFNAIFISK